MTKAMTRSMAEDTATEAVRYVPVDRRSSLSLREFKRDYFNRRPVVVTDALTDWTAQSSWTFEKFKLRFGESIVSVYPYENGTYRADRAQKLSLAEYIDNIRTHNFESYPYYLIYNSSLLQEHKELWAEFSEPKYCYDWFKFIPSFMRFPSPRIYLGPKGAITTLHQDRWGSHFWMAQMEGRKRWILFPPEQADLLYWTRGTGLKRGLVRYQVQPEKPDLERFPLFAKATGVECTIGPGDLLVVPGNWLHWVMSLDATLSLTHNYMARGNFWPCIKGQTAWYFGYLREKMGR